METKGRQNMKRRHFWLGLAVTLALVCLVLITHRTARASNTPPCVPTNTVWDPWSCTAGAITNAGKVTPTNKTIKRGSSATASISGIGIKPGSQVQIGTDNCGGRHTNGPSSYGYVSSNWFEPVIPAVFNNCGTFAYTGKVNAKSQSTNCSGTLGPATAGTFTVQVVDMTAIVDGAGHVISAANGNDKALVGQTISLTAQTCGGTFSNYSWTIPGDAFSSYLANNTTGAVITAIAKTNPSVSFHCKTDGNKQISCSAVCNGISCSANATINVSKPTATVSVVTEDIRIEASYLRYHTNFAGITFTNSVTMPAGFTSVAFDTQWVEIINNSLRRAQLTNGPWLRIQAAGVLDTSYPIIVDSWTSDSPGMTIIADLQRVEVDESFTMTCMFRPSGGDWVSLKKVDWTWSGVATNSPGGWVLVSRNHNSPSATDTTTHPTWSNNITNFFYQPE